MRRSRAFWGMAIAFGLCAPAVAGPGLPVPGFQTVSPPRVVLRPVAPRAMTPGTRARLGRLRRDLRNRNDGAASGAIGGAVNAFNGTQGDLAGPPPPDPYVIPGPARPTNCVGPGPLIIEVGKPLPAPTNLPRVVYGTLAPPCPRFWDPDLSGGPHPESLAGTKSSNSNTLILRRSQSEPRRRGHDCGGCRSFEVALMRLRTSRCQSRASQRLVLAPQDEGVENKGRGSRRRLRMRAA